MSLNDVMPHDLKIGKTPPVFSVGQLVFDGPYDTHIWRIIGGPYWRSESKIWWYDIIDGDGMPWSAPEVRLFPCRIDPDLKREFIRIVK